MRLIVDFRVWRGTLFVVDYLFLTFWTSYVFYVFYVFYLAENINFGFCGIEGEDLSNGETEKEA